MTYTEIVFLSENSELVLFDVTNQYVIEKHNKIKSSKYKDQSKIGYSLLGKMLFKYYGVNINDLNITENEYGKPCFSDSEIYFNISHSENAVACSVSNSEVGVDIEKITEIRDNILKIYSPSEKEQVKSHEDFYKLWTLKESVAKLSGKGLSVIKNIEFTIAPEIRCKCCDLSENMQHKTYTYGEYVVSISSTDTISTPKVIK